MSVTKYEKVNKSMQLEIYEACLISDIIKKIYKNRNVKNGSTLIVLALHRVL